MLRYKYVLNMKSHKLIKLVFNWCWIDASLCKRIVCQNLYVSLMELKPIAWCRLSRVY